MSFLKWLANRRFPAPAAEPEQKLSHSEGSIQKVKERGTHMLVKILTGPAAGQQRHVERNQTTQLLIDTGCIEVIQAPPAAQRQAKWSVGISHTGHKEVLWLTTPLGERVPYSGEPDRAEETFSRGYAHCLPIPEAILQQYAATRKHQDAVSLANEAVKHAPQPQPGTQHWKYPDNY